MIADRFTWSRECQLAFETIKMAVKINIKNYAIKPELPLFIFTDASKVALGIFICQIWEKSFAVGGNTKQNL